MVMPICIPRILEPRYSKPWNIFNNGKTIITLYFSGFLQRILQLGISHLKPLTCNQPNLKMHLFIIYKLTFRILFRFSAELIFFVSIGRGSQRLFTGTLLIFTAQLYVTSTGGL